MQKRRSSLSLLIALLLFVSLLSKETCTAQSKARSYPFLNLPATAHTVAIGGISLTYVDDNPGVAFDNPALYGEESAGRLFLSYLHYMTGTHSANALYGLPFNERASWAVGLRAMNYGKIEGYDVHNQATGSFSATDIALEGLFNYELTDMLRGALAIKLIYSNIERYNALALAVDAGLSYYNSKKGVSLGATITNAGLTLLSYDQSKPLTAWDLRLGYSQAFLHAPIKLHFTAYGLNPIVLRSSTPTQRRVSERILRHFTMGIEYRPFKNFWLAAGYNPRLAQDLHIVGGSFISGLSLGVGFSARHFQVSLAASRYHTSALSFIFTVSTTFGDERFIF